MKITAKTTKQELKDFLGANCKDIKKQDKNLYERLVYADAMLKKDEKQVTRKDLADLAKEVIKVLGNKVVTPAVAEEPVEVKAENSVKKTTKKKETPVEETPKAETKTAKKSLGKKTPKDAVTVLEGAKSEKAVQLAKQFPQTFSVGSNTFELASDIKTIDDLYDAELNGESIMFAFYWTKRHLKQYTYHASLGSPKEFEHDLDLCSTVYVSDKKRVAYAVSEYTEAAYIILSTDFEEEEGIRYASGIEFQIYRVTTKDEDEE